MSVPGPLQRRQQALTALRNRPVRRSFGCSRTKPHCVLSTGTLDNVRRRSFAASRFLRYDPAEADVVSRASRYR